MGIYDREYYQEEPRGIHLGGQTSMVTKLVIVNAAVFLLDMFIGGREHWLTNKLAAHPTIFQEPWYLYQLLTYGFAHSYTDSWHIVGNMIVLWFLGRDVEQLYGPREFLRIYLISIVLGGLVWSLRAFAMGAMSASLVGASGGVTTIVILFALNFPKRTLLLMFLFPIPAWLLGVLWVFGDFVRLLKEPNSNVAFDVHLVGAAFAGAYYLFHWNFGRWMPNRLKMPSFRRRPRLKVHDPESRYHDLDRQADQVLAKLHREGEESLTPAERRILEDYSRRMRQKHG